MCYFSSLYSSIKNDGALFWFKKKYSEESTHPYTTSALFSVSTLDIFSLHFIFLSFPLTIFLTIMNTKVMCILYFTATQNSDLIFIHMVFSILTDSSRPLRMSWDCEFANVWNCFIQAVFTILLSMTKMY